jgi:hypothetical protein
VLLAALLGLAGQDVLPSRPAASVKTLPTFAAIATAPRQTELTVRWAPAAPPAGQPPPGGALLTSPPAPQSQRFEVLRRGAVNEAPVRERDPQVGPDDLVIVAVDAQGREVGWQRVKDPRIVRSEQPGPDGLLSGQVFYRSETELVVRVPDNVAVATLRVYDVQWNGSEFLLIGLGTIPAGRQ